MASGARIAMGRYGEDVAVAHLTAAGLHVLARNWRCRDGEIDIVARDGDVLVMCEVKTRRNADFGTPLDAVTPVKAARLRRLASQWLTEQRLVHQRTASSDEMPAQRGPGYGEIRFDVVSVLRPHSGAAVVEHVRGAF